MMVLPSVNTVSRKVVLMQDTFTIDRVIFSDEKPDESGIQFRTNQL